MPSQISPLDQRPTQVLPCATDQGSTRLQLVRVVPQTDEELEREPLAFDPDEDLLAIIPMPPTIPAAVRSAITRALGHQFEFADELDEWLHAPNEGLAGATPFECVVDGDGLAVLRALGASDELLELRGRLAGYMRDVRLALKLER